MKWISPTSSCLIKFKPCRGQDSRSQENPKMRPSCAQLVWAFALCFWFNSSHQLVLVEIKRMVGFVLFLHIMDNFDQVLVLCRVQAILHGRGISRCIYIYICSFEMKFHSAVQRSHHLIMQYCIMSTLLALVLFSVCQLNMFSLACSAVVFNTKNHKCTIPLCAKPVMIEGDKNFVYLKTFSSSLLRRFLI